MNPIIFLHGALGTSDQLNPLVQRIDSERPVHLMNFEGHGAGELPGRPFRMEYFSENILTYMNTHRIEQADLFGYSMGGYAALCVAKDHPGRVGKIATLGTVLKWSPDVAERECKYLNPKKIQEKVPQFAEELSRRHPAGWQKVTEMTKDLLMDLGRNPRITDDDWGKISHSVRIHAGDRDQTAGIDQSVEVYRLLTEGELAVLPNTPHPIEKANLDMLIGSLEQFFRPTA